MPLPRVTLTPQQLSSFARQAPSSLAGNVAAGQRIMHGIEDVGAAAGALGRGAVAAGDRFLQAGQSGLRPILHGAGQVADQLINTSGGRHLMGAAAVATPILAATYRNTVAPAEGEMMNMRDNPERVVLSTDLSTFMSKIAATQPASPPAHHGFGGGGMGSEFAKGVGNAVGKTLIESAVTALASGGSALMDYVKNDRARKQLVDELIRTDPVLSDAVKHDPKAAVHIMESYETMKRFAPALSVDRNAVRSFLREALLSGGSINYNTIKTLADTQKSVTGTR